MASPTTHIDQFEVMYSSNRFSPRVWLISSGKFIGQLIFCPNALSPLPVDSKDTKTGQVSLHYHLDDFQNVKDLLETEKNTYLLYSGSGPGFENGILTTAEPAGAGIEVKVAA
jgi:hypothetical protein